MAESVDAGAAPDRPPRRVPGWPALALLAICLAAGGLGLYEAAADAPTIDEPVYVVAGLASLTRHDLHLNTQHPPLAKALAALPVLLAGPPSPGGAVWARGGERAYAAAFMRRARAERKLRTITLLSRLIPLLMLMASGVLIFALGRRLGGDRGGLFAAGLWLLNPYVIGIGHVDGIDIPAAVSVLLTVLAVVRWDERRSTARLMAVAAACAAAMLVRDTGPLVALVAFGVVAWRSKSARLVAVAGVSLLASIWLVYLVLDPRYTLAHPDLLPQRYVDGLQALASAHSRPAPAFLFGHVWNGGRWWFWPGSMLIKLPASMLLAFAIVPFALWRRRPRPGVLIVAAVAMAVVLSAFTVISPVDFGLRYLLPPIALACVACAALAPMRTWALGLLVAVGAAFVVASAPSSIAWTAPPFGNGYDIAAAGNLDWGQDAWRLQDWARGKRPWIACYTPGGSGCVEDVAGARRLTKGRDPRTVHGWVALSATLRNLHGWDPWLARRRPVVVIGGTELIYRLP